MSGCCLTNARSRANTIEDERAGSDHTPDRADRRRRNGRRTVAAPTSPARAHSVDVNSPSTWFFSSYVRVPDRNQDMMAFSAAFGSTHQSLRSSILAPNSDLIQINPADRYCRETAWVDEKYQEMNTFGLINLKRPRSVRKALRLLQGQSRSTTTSSRRERRRRRQISGAQHCVDVVPGRLVRTDRTQGASPSQIRRELQLSKSFRRKPIPRVGVAGRSGPPDGLQRDAVRLLDAGPPIRTSRSFLVFITATIP